MPPGAGSGADPAITITSPLTPVLVIVDNVNSWTEPNRLNDGFVYVDIFQSPFAADRYDYLLPQVERLANSRCLCLPAMLDLRARRLVHGEETNRPRCAPLPVHTAVIGLPKP